MTRIPLSRSKGQRSRSPDRFAHRRVGASGGCSGGCENVLAVGNCCYVTDCYGAKRFGAHGEERGGGIPWQPPAYSLFKTKKDQRKIKDKIGGADNESRK